MFSIPHSVEVAAYLFDLEYYDTAASAVRHLRWAGGDSEIPVPGEGTYMPAKDIKQYQTEVSEGVHLQRREWGLVIKDPQFVYSRQRFSTNWENRKCAVKIWSNPGNRVTPYRTWFLRSRAEVTDDENDRVLVLGFGDQFSRIFATNKRYITDAEQRKIDEDDDGLAQTLVVIDLNWGGS